MDERVNRRWSVGPYEIVEVEFQGSHPFASQTLYRYTIDGQKVDSELYPSLDRALVSAVGARHMGQRGASGNAVGTAADWFCVMVGINEDEEQAKSASVPVEPVEKCPGSGAGWMTTELGIGGYRAKCRHCGVTAEDLHTRPELAGNRYLGWVPEHVNR